MVLALCRSSSTAWTGREPLIGPASRAAAPFSSGSPPVFWCPHPYLLLPLRELWPLRTAWRSRPPTPPECCQEIGTRGRRYRQADRCSLRVVTVVSRSRNPNLRRHDEQHHANGHGGNRGTVVERSRG